MTRFLAGLILVLLIFTPPVCFGKDLGVIGNVYKIEEKDPIPIMKERAAKIDWNKVGEGVLDRAKKRSFRPHDSTIILPKAEKYRKRVIDMSQELEWDIRGADGKVIYPKGTRINPGDYVRLSRVPVVIDASDPSQVEWFLKRWGKSINVALLLTNGDLVNLTEKLTRRVFWANDFMIKRFQLEKVPSEIRQVGNMIVIEEFHVQSKEPKAKK